MRLFLLAAMPLLLAGAPAFADEPATQPPQAQPAKERMICKMEEETGSLVRKHRTCLTAKQWATSQEEARKEAERLQTRPAPLSN